MYSLTFSKFNENTNIPIMANFSGDFRSLHLKLPTVFSHSELFGHSPRILDSHSFISDRNRITRKLINLLEHFHQEF